MARGNYGRVGGNRRSGGGAWQWAIIGLIFGLGCSAVFVLGLLTLGVLNIEGVATEVAVQNTPMPAPTQDVEGTVSVIVAATIAAQPAAAEQAPVVVTATESTGQQSGVQVAPSATSQPTFTPEVLVTTEIPAQQPADNTEDASQPNVTTEDSSQILAPSDAAGSEVPVELVSLVSDLVRVDGGTFEMGTTPREVSIAVEECVSRDGGACTAEMGADSSPAHSVTLDSFFIESTEVTNEQYVAFLNFLGPNSHTNGCFGQPCVDVVDSDDDVSIITFDSQNYDFPPLFSNQPIVGVTWFGARKYCETIGRRLPTEAEWERAARGPDNFIYPWGDIWDVNYARTNRPDPTDVGVVDIQSYPENVAAWGSGIFDMAGNAAEWVADFYSPNYYSQPAAVGLNPQGPPSGTERAIRGGSWDTPPFFSRTVHRQSLRPNETALWLGFRCADDFDDTVNLQDSTVNPADLGPSNSELLPPVEPTDEPINAAPTLEPLPATADPDATEVPLVPPGG